MKQKNNKKKEKKRNKIRTILYRWSRTRKLYIIIQYAQRWCDLRKNYIFRIAPGGGVGDLKQYTGNDVGILYTHIHIIIIIIQHNINNNGIMPVQCRGVVPVVVVVLLLLLCGAPDFRPKWSSYTVSCTQHVLFTLAQLAKIIIIYYQGPSPRRSGYRADCYNTKRHWHLSSRTRRFRLLRLNVEIPTIRFPLTHIISEYISLTNSI